MRRRLVRRDPTLVPASDRFRDFVRRTEPAETIARWESADLSGMDVAARFLPAALLAGLVLIFATQRDVFNATTTLIGVAGTALPQLLKLLANVQPNRQDGATV